MMGDWIKKRTKNKPRLFSLPPTPHYDEESRLFSGLKDRPKNKPGCPYGGAILIEIKEKHEGKGASGK